MGSYVMKRLLVSVPLLAAISFITFLFVHLSPMDPAEVILQAQGVPQITGELIAQTKAELGMDRPFLIRYMSWLLACLQLDFGESYVTGQPVWSLLGPALLNTLKLTLASVAVIIAMSIALGVICALYEGKLLDQSVRGVFFFLTSMPSYGLAALLIWYFSVKLDLLPTSGMDSYAGYILPVSVIAIGYAGVYFRVVRSAMLSQLHEEYVWYGRACGLQEFTIIRNMLRNSLQAAISVFCMAIPVILGSTVVVENVFAWPGLGSLSIKSILSRDFPVIQAYVLVLAAAFVFFNAAADMIHAMVNPKVRKESQ